MSQSNVGILRSLKNCFYSKGRASGSGMANFQGTKSCLQWHAAVRHAALGEGTPRCGGGMRSGQGRRSWGLRLVAVEVLDVGEAG